MNLIGRIVRKVGEVSAELGKAVRANGLSRTFKNKVVPTYSPGLMKLRGISPEGKTHYLYARGVEYPLNCRYNSSDRQVFRTVFEQCEYDCLDDVKDVRLVVDCGANVGYSSIYFLARFPQAKVICLEPDSKNFAILERNLKPYGDRVKLLQTGVWSHTTGLTVCRGEFRDGLEWATQVRESRDGETPDVQATDLGTVLRESGFEKIDILKIDIERSETEVFARNYAEWLGKTRNMVIELHDEECERVFYNAIAPYPFALSQSVEVVVCKSN